MTPSNPPVCPQCGAAIPDASEHGLCPRCVFAKAVQPTSPDGAAALPPPTPDELAPLFPQLEILECLGRGGMGVVYKAKQKSLNRLVALKLLAPERAGDPQFAARFEKEAQALAALSHPHIVSVFDFGQIPASHTSTHAPQPGFYLLMEFVNGVNLRQLLETKKLTPKEALSIVPPICDALQCAHERGIVHRDIKPENLLIDKAGIVKIADFGIAKMMGEVRRTETAEGTEKASHHDVSSVSVESSISFHAAGTPAYAAPEQANGAADHRADIYSLGVVLYEMLTGERPNEAITPPSKRVQVDVRIDEIVLRALEKTPELRFATAAELRTQLEQAACANTPAPRSARWLRVATFGVLALLPLAFVYNTGDALLTLAFQRMGLAPGLRWLALICVLLVPVWLLALILGLWNALVIHKPRPLPPWQKRVALSALVGAPCLVLLYFSARHHTNIQASAQAAADRQQAMIAVQRKIAGFHRGQPDNRAVVKVVYFHAADREPLPNHAERLDRALSDVSDFYRDGLERLGVRSQGIPFERDERGKIKLRLVRGAQPSNHYKHESGDETWAEVQRALLGVIDRARDHVLILYGLCDTARDGRYIFHAPYYGAGGSNHQQGLCHAADCELLDPRNLTSTRRMVFSEHYYAKQEMSVAQFNSWYLGGIAHELGHAFGLPHDSGAPEEAVLGTSLMGGGNLTYREGMHGGKKPSFLSLASALRLAAHPLFTRSDRARWEDVDMGPFQVEAAAEGASLNLSGQLMTNVPACAVIASVWSAAAKQGRDHDAQTFCSAVDEQGRFRLRSPPPGDGRWNLRLGVVLANGAEPEVRTSFAVKEGVPQAGDLTMLLQVGAVEAILQKDPLMAAPLLTDAAIAIVKPDEARHRLKLLQRMTLPEAPPIDLDATSEVRVSLSDARWTKAEVGWGSIARNRWGAPPDFEQGLLLTVGGEVMEKGLHAHAASRFEFATNGRWHTFTATTAMRDGAPEFGSAVFIVEGDGVELARSRFLRGGQSEAMKVKIDGVRTLVLRAEGTEGNNHGCWAMWGEPVVERVAR